MKFRRSLLALVALALMPGACSEGPAPAAPASEPAVATAAQPADKPQPKVGDKIPEPREDLATSNRMAAAGIAASERAARGIREIGWEELMPEGEEEKIAAMYQKQMALLYSGAPVAEGSSEDAMIQIGTFNTVAELNEVKVRIPGYTVPFEYGSKAEITEFLLVPYYGACIHSPPPPPNQTLFVITDTPIKLKDLAQAVWIEGTLYTQMQSSELADAAYTLKVEKIEVYDY